jgi:hypothetical protein
MRPLELDDDDVHTIANNFLRYVQLVLESTELALEQRRYRRRCHLMSRRVRMSQNIPLGHRLYSSVAMAQNIRSTLCRSMYLRTSLFVQRCRAGSSPSSTRTKLRTPYCTLTWSKYSPRRATTTTALGTRLPSSRRLGFSSDRNITKRPSHPVRSCC